VLRACNAAGPLYLEPNRMVDVGLLSKEVNR
jgi:hypothetical protein